MQTAIDHKEILRLYEALNERVLAKDSKGTLQIYDELLRLGQPLSEIMAHGLRALDEVPLNTPDNSGKALGEGAGTTVLDEPAPYDARPGPVPQRNPEPPPGTAASRGGEPPEWTNAPDAFGEPPPPGGDKGNQAPLLVPAIATPGVRLGSHFAAKVRLSRLARLGLATGTIAVLAGIGVLLMQPAAQQVALGSLVGEALAIVRGETAPTPAEPAPVPSAPEPDVAAAVMAPASTVPPAEPRSASSPTAASPIPEAPPPVTGPNPTTSPDQQRPLGAEIAALIARSDNLLKAGAAVTEPAPTKPPDQPHLAEPAPTKPPEQPHLAEPAPTKPPDQAHLAEPAPTAPPDQARLAEPAPTIPPDQALLAEPAPTTPPKRPHLAQPAPTIPPRQPRLAAAEIAALRERGDTLLGVGDIASARLFYERASDAGDGRAALRLGATYDPGFLDQVQLPHLQGNAAQALSWYRRARDLGESEAERWIQALEAKSGR